MVVPSRSKPRLAVLVPGALTAAVVWAIWVERVEACDEVTAPSVTEGLLGTQSHTTEAPADVEIPRNVAFAFWAGRERPALLQDGAPVELEALGPAPSPGHAGLLSPPMPLEVGRSYDYAGIAFRVADYVDEATPTRPNVEKAELSVTEYDSGCGTSSCGDRTVVVSAELAGATDDRTPGAHLTYALYLGETAKASSTAVEPERLALLENGRVWFFADDGWADRDAYLSIATLDLAGNESERTEPIRIHTAPGGCVIAGATRSGELVWLAAALLACALRARRLAAGSR